MPNETRNETRTNESAQRRAPLDALQLIVADGPSRGVRLTLSRGTVLVGSDPECDLVVRDDTVSRRHASVGLVPDGVLVRDLKSRNGTRYLGARIDQAVIPVGASMKLGKTTVRVDTPAGADSESAENELYGLTGHSRPMKKLFARLPKVAQADATVLLLGETGTGKSDLARVIHELSPRSDAPFVTVDCGAVNANLIESTLFGHVRGAFTGADRDRPGMVEQANGGTLFLDEIGELPLDIQPRFLRLLQEHQFVPVGGATVKTVELRVIAATVKDLEDQVKRGRFRKDLYFRLSAVELQLPPLRDRRDDIAPLARKFARELKGVDVRLQPRTIAAFQCERWPGNVRELKNAVVRALTLGSEEQGPAGKAESFAEARDAALLHFERDYLVALLEENGGNASAAARAAKLARSYFYKLLERHQLVSNPAPK